MVVLQKKTNIIYQLRYTLGDFISENNSIYIDLTLTTLSRWFTMHLSNTSSTAQHLKNIPTQKLSFRKFLPKTQQ